EVQAFYQAEVARHGLTFRGLGYNRRESQVRRFQVLAEVGPLDGARLLDVGAGLGDFLLYLWQRGVECDYTGLDICEHLTRAAQRRFADAPSTRPRFMVGDILEHREPPAAQPPYDVVVSSGVFGLKAAGNAERVAPTLERMFSLCRRAVAVNFLSARAAHQAERSEYLEPTAVLHAALRITPAVTLRHDYLPNDFTLYLYRERRWPA